MPDDLQPVIEALKAGDRQQARQLLRPLLKDPTADTLYYASFVCKPTEAEAYLLAALERAPQHRKAQGRLSKIRREAARAAPEFITTAALDALPPLEMLTGADLTPSSTVYDADLPPKRPARRKPRGVFSYIGCGATILLSLSLSYFMLLLLGSSLPGQVRSLLARSDGRVMQPEGTLVYATPVATFEGTPLYAHPFLEREIDATPVVQIEGTPVYARPDAVTVVQPVVSRQLAFSEPLSDVLEPGYAHEYTFAVTRDEEIAIGIQFFSPFAQSVSRNIRVVDLSGDERERACTRESILGGDTGVGFICKPGQSGEWKLRLFGREGESSGAYVVALEKF